MGNTQGTNQRLCGHSEPFRLLAPMNSRLSPSVYEAFLYRLPCASGGRHARSGWVLSLHPGSPVVPSGHTPASCFSSAPLSWVGVVFSAREL